MNFKWYSWIYLVKNLQEVANMFGFKRLGSLVLVYPLLSPNWKMYIFYLDLNAGSQEILNNGANGELEVSDLNAKSRLCSQFQ